MSKNVAAKSWELSVYNGRRYSAGPPIVVDGWPLHEPAYLSVLPGVAGPGMDTPAGTGRHLETPATSVYFINSLENANSGAALTGLGPNVFGGTVEWCRRATASPKVIIPLVSGWAVLQKSLPLQTGTPPRPGYVTEAYHFAPHPGLWLRGAKVSLNGASDVAVWHLRSYMGDDEAGLSAANRDPMGSGYTGGTVTNVAAINCELAWSCDELLDMYYSHDGVSLVNCAFINPLHESSLNPSEDHGFGPMMGGGAQFGVAATFRCLWSNITDRAPFTNSVAHTHANNLHWNSGRPGGGAGYALRIVNQAATEAVLVNAMSNGFVRGPENNNNIVAVATTATLPAGSQGYLEDNAVHGWTAATQAALLSTSISGFAQSALIEDAYPPEWGEDGVLRWSAQAPMPTEQEWDGYVSLMEATVGSQPGWRMSQFGKVSSVFQAVKDTLGGNMPGFQFSDSVADEGGWFDVPEVGPIDPTDPGSHWWAAFPTSGRDDVLDGSATWGNESWVPDPFRGTGLQLAGRTVLERWIIKQHWYVMDPSTRPPLPEPTGAYFGLTPTIYAAPSALGTGDGSSEANAMALSSAITSPAPGEIIGALPGDYSRASANSGLTPAWQIGSNGTSGSPIIVVAKHSAALSADPITDENVSRLRHTGSALGNGSPIAGGYQKSYQQWWGFYCDENDGIGRTDCATIHWRSSNNVEFHHMVARALTSDPGFGSDNHSGIGVRNCEDVLIADCKASGYNHNGSHNHNGLVRYDTERLTVRNCEIWGCTTGIYLKDSPGQVGGVNEVVQYNLLHDNGTDCEVACVLNEGCDVSHNLMTNSAAGLLIANDTTGVVCHHNTVVCDGDASGEGGCVVANYAGGDSIVRDSILVQRGGANLNNQRYRSGAAIQSDYNRYHSSGSQSYRLNGSNYSSLSAWQSGASRDANSTYGDPLFVGGSDYRLQPGSPCRTASSTSGPVGCYVTGTEQIGPRPQ